VTTTHKRGDVRADGFTFSHCRPGYGPVWNSPGSWLRQNLLNTRLKAKKRAEDNDLPFDIDVEHLIDIYPADRLCPVFGTPLVWGQSRSDAPTLDRREPSKGYVKGNVAFISHRANRIKSDASKEDLERILAYLN
jgi:hypothetical protein